MQRPLWYRPSHKDSRYIGTEIGTRFASFGYLKQIAQAVDNLGYQGALVPTVTNCEDSWVAASTLASSLDRVADGRLIINVVGGGDPAKLEGDGVFLDQSERDALMDEFLSV